MTNSDSDIRPAQPGDLLDSGGDEAGIMWRIRLDDFPERVGDRTPLLRVKAELMVPERVLREVHIEGWHRPSVLGQPLQAAWGEQYTGRACPGEVYRSRHIQKEGDEIAPLVNVFRAQFVQLAGEVASAWRTASKEAADLEARRHAACVAWATRKD